jgi:predicted RNA-binding Zn ribbon-like protein
MADPVPLTGEPVALDLVNTRPATGDLLGTLDGLRGWLELQADRLPQGRELAVELTEADLTTIHAVREHIAQTVDRLRRGEPPAATALESLNGSQRTAPAVDELTWNGTSITVVRRRTGTAGAQLAAWLAEAAAHLLADPAASMIRQCEADDCVMLFMSAHSRRRWCSATRCGNRVRVARHYQRHRPTRART